MDTAPKAEVGVRRIVLLAPGTRHAGASQAGSAKGRNRGPRLTARDSHGQEHGHRGHAWGRGVPAVTRRAVARAFTAGPERGLESVSALESFPLCYTAARREGTRREAKVE